MTRLLEIASNLRDLRTQLIAAQLAKYEAGQAISKRTIEITPADGWPGKNADERKVAQEKAVLEDAELKKAQKKLDSAQETILLTEAAIEGLHDERRALEWGIRSRLADSIMGPKNGREPAEHTAFDHAADQALDADIDF